MEVKVLSDVAIVLPTLAEQIKNFTNTLTTVVDELVSYFDKIVTYTSMRQERYVKNF